MFKLKNIWAEKSKFDCLKFSIIKFINKLQSDSATCWQFSDVAPCAFPGLGARTPCTHWPHVHSNTEVSCVPAPWRTRASRRVTSVSDGAGRTRNGTRDRPGDQQRPAETRTWSRVRLRSTQVRGTLPEIQQDPLWSGFWVWVWNQRNVSESRSRRIRTAVLSNQDQDQIQIRIRSRSRSGSDRWSVSVLNKHPQSLFVWQKQKLKLRFIQHWTSLVQRENNIYTCVCSHLCKDLLFWLSVVY